MREVILYDPITIGLSLAGAVAAGSIVGGIVEGRLAEEQSKAEAAFLIEESKQVIKQRDRDLKDLERERSRKLARSRAVLAASGADTTSNTSLAVLTSQSSFFGRVGARIRDDAAVSIASLAAKARVTKRLGIITRDQAIVSGFLQAGVRGGTVAAPFLGSRPRSTKTGGGTGRAPIAPSVA